MVAETFDYQQASSVVAVETSDFLLASVERFVDFQQLAFEARNLGAVECAAAFDPGKQFVTVLHLTDLCSFRTAS